MNPEEATATEEVEEIQPSEGEQGSQQFGDFSFGEPEPQEQPAPSEEETDIPTNEEEESASPEPPVNEDSEQDEPDEVIPQFDTQLQEISGGQVNNVEEFNSLMEEIGTLREAVKNPQPQFDSEAQQRMYDFVRQYGNGEDMAAASTYLNVVGMDLESAEPSDVLFQKFKIDNPQLSDERAIEIFNEEMEEDFPEDMMESSARKQFQYEQRVENDKKFLSNLQKEYIEGKPSTKAAEEDSAQQEQLSQVQETISEQAKAYKGIGMSFKMTDKGVEIGSEDPSNPLGNFNLEINAEQAKEFSEIAKDPSKFWESVLQTDKGQPNYQNYFDLLNFTMNKEAIYKEMVSHGYNMAKVQNERKAKNIQEEVAPGGKGIDNNESDLLTAIKIGQRG